jgi:hypothetical protein
MARAVKSRRQAPTSGKPAGRRGNLTIRIGDELREHLQKRAEADQRSLSEEVERSLERSRDQQRLLDQVVDLTYRDPALVALLLQLGAAMRDTVTIATGPIRGAAWAENSWAFNQVAEAARFVIEAHRPEGTADPPNATIATDLGERIARGVLRGITSPPEEISPPAEIRAARERTSATMMARLMERSQGPIALIVGMPPDDPQSPAARRRRPSAKAAISP